MTHRKSLLHAPAPGLIRSVRVLLAILLTSFASAALVTAETTPAGAMPSAHKRALILVSAAFGATATDRYVSGLLNGMKKEQIGSGDISIEYLDLARHMGCLLYTSPSPRD